MKTENATKITYPDYKSIRELSHCIDCIITEADFNTSHPNPYRIDYLVSDIHRYLKRGGKLNVFSY